ncbi:hypothetical protein EZS27_014766 [termite gut metagenome]|uniref:Uncharacterized protein n=1 Tax=termite gut metagenome TaxID=433724 RepID=A0A5J4RVY8_9ZZZZ
MAPILGQLITLSEQLSEVSDALSGLDEAGEDLTRAKDRLLTKADPAKLTWAQVLVNYHARISALELQAKVLGLSKDEDGNTVVINGILGTIQAQILALQTGIPGGEGGEPDYSAIANALADVLVTNEDFLTAIIDAIGEINPDLVTLRAEINSLVTGIAYLKDNNPNLTFNRVPALVEYTFGEGLTGAISFATSKTGDGVATASVLVRVTPTNAKLTEENIVLINNKEQTGVNDYVKVYGVDAYTGLVTKADGGIYKVTFTLGENYDASKLNALINSGGKKVAFAIAVKSSTETGTRYVATDYDTSIGVNSTSTSVYNSELSYTVNGTPLKDLTNRYDGSSDKVKEKAWTSTMNPKNNVDPSTKIKDDSEDVRKKATLAPLAAAIGEGVEVELDEDFADNILAYYIDFDTNGATDADKTLWAAGNISGLDQVYGTKDPAIITANASALEGKEVGYRVYAVNYDGTLVDPDGKAFYVSYGAKALTGEPINFVYNIIAAETAVAKETPNRIAFVFPEGADVNKVADYTFEINAENGTGDGEKFSTGDLERYPSESAPKGTGVVHNWRDTKFLALGNIDLTKLNDEGRPYSGSLKLLDASGHALVTYPVTLTKNMPTKFPVDGLKLAQAILEKDGRVDLAANAAAHTFADALDKDVPGWSGISANLAVSLSYTDIAGVSHTNLIKSANTFTPSDDWKNQDITVTIGYNFNAIAYGNANAANNVFLSNLKYILRYGSTTLSNISYSWDTNKAWNSRIVYSKTANEIKKKDGGIIDITIADIKAKKGTGNAVSLKFAANAIYNSSTITTGILRLIDNAGNSTNVNAAISGDATAITFGAVTLPAGVSDFTPTKAIFYLNSLTIPAASGVTWNKVEVIGFDITTITETVVSSTTVAALNVLNAVALDAISSGTTFAQLVQGIVGRGIDISAGYEAEYLATTGELSFRVTSLDGLTLPIYVPTSNNVESLAKIAKGESAIYSLTAKVYGNPVGAASIGTMTLNGGKAYLKFNADKIPTKVTNTCIITDFKLLNKQTGAEVTVAGIGELKTGTITFTFKD